VFPLERLFPLTPSRARGPVACSPPLFPEAVRTPRYRREGRVPALPEPLRVTNPRAAGIDVHSDVHWVGPRATCWTASGCSGCTATAS
jgi:hypothetical protein